ncbi:translocation complex subunit Sss1 [Histoplasma ohiense]|nr:translocation complex subunit Sss1 [Histoplasma ohiense (nom. inval.)]
MGGNGGGCWVLIDTSLRSLVFLLIFLRTLFFFCFCRVPFTFCICTIFSCYLRWASFPTLLFCSFVNSLQIIPFPYFLHDWGVN